MKKFLGFTPDQQFTLLSKMGYSGPKDKASMDQFMEANPAAASKMGSYTQKALERLNPQPQFATGGVVQNPSNLAPTSTLSTVNPQTITAQQLQTAQKEAVAEAYTNPAGLITQAPAAQIQEQPNQTIAEDTGQVQAPNVVTPQTVLQTAQAQAPQQTQTNTVQTATASGQVQNAVQGVQAAQGQVSQQAQVTAAQQNQSAVSGLEAAQGTAYLMTNPVQRELQAGEVISGSAVDAAKVNTLMEGIQAAQATPSEQATVQGQLANLMTQFEGGQTPAWAAGAIRAAQATLAARGLGASSMAGQAVIQAAMESALPIAQIDANTRAQFEAQNLSNRQQTALFAAQQRAAFLQQEFDQGFQTRVLNAAKVSDIANMNFTAEQNIALENSRAVNTMNLANLSNKQALVMANAAALSNLEITNLNNRQQAAVQNAQSFLQMDMANLDREQQTAIFKSQAVIQSLLTDQAAENASRQFNASSKNQTDQFFAGLQESVSRFNADQTNALNQFNAGQTNAVEQFNSQMQAQRDQFNAQNSLVIAQANAQWRQTIATTNTMAQHEANMQNAKAATEMTQLAMDAFWQRERDLMAFAFQSSENSLDRSVQLMLGDKQQSLGYAQLKAEERAGMGAVLGSVVRGIFG